MLFLMCPNSDSLTITLLPSLDNNSKLRINEGQQKDTTDDYYHQNEDLVFAVCAPVIIVTHNSQTIKHYNHL